MSTVNSTQNLPVEAEVMRAYRRRDPGKDYRLRVVPGTHGLLELIEVPPKRTLFQEWARAMQFAGWMI